MLFLMQSIVGMSHVITVWLILLEKYEKLFLFCCYNVNLTKPIVYSCAAVLYTWQDVSPYVKDP